MCRPATNRGRPQSSRPTSRCCAPSATSCVAAASARCSRTDRHARPRRLERRLRRGRQLLLLSKRAVRYLLARTRTEGRARRRSQLPRVLRLQRRSLRRAGRTPGRSSPTFFRRSAFCAAPICAAISGRRDSARGRPHSARAAVSNAGQHQLHHQQQNRLDTRELARSFQTELTNSDVASVALHRQFERLVRPFNVATGVNIPVGEL